MGGGGSKCTKQDHIDPKPSVDMNVGITVAGSEGCKGCSLSFPLGNTASEVILTREQNTIVITPLSPLAAIFNGKQAVFTKLHLYHPAPLRVEGIQADAVLECIDEGKIQLFIPINKSAGEGGTSIDFLNMIAAQLSPSTSAGLGIVNKDTKKYEEPSVHTGAEWALTRLVSGTDPYFTWVNSELEQYTKADIGCDRYIGWKSKTGAQVIYFQNPVSVSAEDVEALIRTTGAVMPGDVLAAVQHPLYSAGEPNNCKPRSPKLKLPTIKMSKGFNDFIMFFLLFCGMLLAIVLAIAFVNSDVLKPFAAGLTRLFAWRTPKPSSPAAANTPGISPNDISSGLSSLMSSRTSQLPSISSANDISSRIPSLAGLLRR
jgi:hypothetical protein